MAYLNLLPWRDAQKKQQQARFMTTITAACVSSFLLVFGVSAVYSSMIEGQDGRNNYLQGEIAILDQRITEIKQLDEDRAAVHFPSEKTNGEAICTIAGFPVFVCESMPNDILALIFPNDKLFPGDKMEMTMHVASYVETAGASQP